MCYDLADGEHVSASLDEDQIRALEVIYWPGGVSVSVNGDFAVFDQQGNKLHDLWGG
ncbi:MULTISPECIES: hypothetical protein [Amycolatopsis]|uniref:Uncharacterized protein n=1 Tax=Amycolatopsis albidoflavus TaxID=102226 RepID=A0ABW5HV19_9PSEU